MDETLNGESDEPILPLENDVAVELPELPGTTADGCGFNRLRWFVLVANLGLPGIAIATTKLYLHFKNPDPRSWFTLVFFAPVIAIIVSTAPVIFACVVAAWGPWRLWIRCLLFGFAIALTSVAIECLTGSLWDFPSITFVSVVETFFSLAAIFISATLVLILIGSLLRLRLGPSRREPVRVSIIGIMCATAVSGGMIVAKARVDQWVYQENIRETELLESPEFADGPDEPESPDARQQFQAGAMWQVMLVGPISGLLIAICAASYCRWIPRLIVVLLPVAYAAWAVAINPPNSLMGPMMGILIAMILAVIVSGYWTALCLYVLKRSGWPLSRRLVTSPLDLSTS